MNRSDDANRPLRLSLQVSAHYRKLHQTPCTHHWTAPTPDLSPPASLHLAPPETTSRQRRTSNSHPFSIIYITLPTRIILQPLLTINVNVALLAHAQLIIWFPPEAGQNCLAAHVRLPITTSIHQGTSCPFINPRMAGRHPVPVRAMGAKPLLQVPMLCRDHRPMRQC